MSPQLGLTIGGSGRWWFGGGVVVAIAPGPRFNKVALQNMKGEGKYAMKE